MVSIKYLLIAVLVAQAAFAQNRGHEVFKDVEYTQAVLNTPSPVNIRKGTIEWPHPQTYSDTYGDNQMVWWYIPVPTGWKLDIYMDFHFIEETYDRITIWPVYAENCGSFACNVTTDATGTRHHHNFVQYPSEFLYQLNSSVIVEFDSDVSRGYKGFKLTWFAYPKDATFRYGRSKRLCCTSIQPLQLWEYYCLHFTTQAEQYCDCNTYYTDITKSSNDQTQLYVRLFGYGLPRQYITNPIVVDVTTMGTASTTDTFSLRDSEQELRFLTSVTVSATCPWSPIFGIEWFEIPHGQEKLYSNEQEITQVLILEHQRWPTGASTTDPDIGSTTLVTFLPPVSPLPPVQYNLTSLTGNITSPNYPDRYPALNTTIWNFPYIPGAYLLFYIRDFNLEDNYDVLEVRSNRRNIAFNYTGILNNKVFRMVYSDAIFTFISDTTIQRAGFFINYTIVTTHPTTAPQTTPVTRPFTPTSPPATPGTRPFTPTTIPATRPFTPLTTRVTSPFRPNKTITATTSITTTKTRPTMKATTTRPTTRPPITRPTTKPPTTLPATKPPTRSTPIKTSTATTKPTTSTLTTITTVIDLLPGAAAGASKDDPKKSNVATIVVPVVIVVVLIVASVIGIVYWYNKYKKNTPERDSNYAVFTNDLYSSNRGMIRPGAASSGPSAVENSNYGYVQSTDGKATGSHVPAAVVAIGKQAPIADNDQPPRPQVQIPAATAPSEGFQSLAEIAENEAKIDPSVYPSSPTATLPSPPRAQDPLYANIGHDRQINVPVNEHIHDVPYNSLPIVQTHTTTSDA